MIAVSKWTVEYIPILGWLVWLGGTIFVQRSNHTKSIDVMNTGQRNTTRIQARGFLVSDPMQDVRGPCYIDRNRENYRSQFFIVDTTDTSRACDSGDRKACRDKVYGRRRQKRSGLFDSHRYLKLDFN